jgi:hypothetical protein
MVSGWIRKLFLRQQEKSKTPWAMFEVAEFTENGQAKVNFSWNDAFLDQIQKHGFHAETPEDTVQLFFYASKMSPAELAGGDDPVQPGELPALSGRANSLRT